MKNAKILISSDIAINSKIANIHYHKTSVDNFDIYIVSIP